MQLSLLGLALLAAPILAFTIPEGQPEGLYQVSYENGEEVHTFIRANDISASSTAADELTGSVNSAKFRHIKRGGDYSCGGDALDHHNTDVANGNLDHQCGGGQLVNQGHDFYSIQGCTVAYACNFSGQGIYCSSGDRQRRSSDITNRCGSYISGWYNPNGNELSYGYENFCKSPGNNFCGRGP